MNKCEKTNANSKEALNEMYATLNNSEDWHKHKSLIIHDLDELENYRKLGNINGGMFIEKLDSIIEVDREVHYQQVKSKLQRIELLVQRGWVYYDDLEYQINQIQQILEEEM